MNTSRVFYAHINQQQTDPELQDAINAIFADKRIKTSMEAVHQFVETLIDTLTPINQSRIKFIIKKTNDNQLECLIMTNQNHNLDYYHRIFNLDYQDEELLPYDQPDKNPVLIIGYGRKQYQDTNYVVHHEPMKHWKSTIDANFKWLIYYKHLIRIITNNYEQQNTSMVYKDFQSTETIANLADHIMTKYHHVLIDVDKGGGKTFMSIHAVGRMCQQANLLIFTTPNKQKSRDWEDSTLAYNKAKNTQLRAYTFNYNVLANNNNFNTTVLPFVKEILYQYQTKQIPCVIILDEGHKTKNTTSLTTKHLMSIRKFFDKINTMNLTATPIGNSLTDMITNLILAGFYPNKTAFLREQVKQFDQWHQPVVTNSKGQIDLNCFYEPDRILKMIHEITAKIDTEDKLPPRTTANIEFSIPTRELISDYAQIRQNYMDGMYETVAETISEQRKWLANHYEELGITPWIKDTILNPQRPQDAVLIFYSLNPELDALKDYLSRELPNYHLRELNGNISEKQRQQNLLPPDDPAHTIYLIQYQAGAEALNAPWSHTAILAAPTSSYILFNQALGRNRRAGQKGQVYQFRCDIKHTLYHHIWFDCLDHKQDFDTSMQKDFIENTKQQIDNLH